MSAIAIRAESISKEYRIGALQNKTDTITGQLMDIFKIPVRRFGNLLSGQGYGSSDLINTIWALKDVSFKIDYGEVVGVIGRNGAGKSTLLKILSHITEPTSGYVDIYGRVGSLLEVGTGFHPELSGRENVYLNGAILGMRKAEIEHKFDEIVDFAEVEQFIDTPVKHYSSGMYVRLAFSVAAHLEPEILLVDEVLAVGDISFQKKCLGKMDDVSRLGRSIIFVSHNMNALLRLCPRSILISDGFILGDGNTKDIISEYLSIQENLAIPGEWIDISDVSRKGTGEAKINSVYYSSDNEFIGYKAYPNGPLNFIVEIESESFLRISSLAVTIYDRYGTKLINADSTSIGRVLDVKRGKNQFCVQINRLYLNPGSYLIGFWLANPPGEVYDHIPSAFEINVFENNINSDIVKPLDDGAVICDFQILENI